MAAPSALSSCGSKFRMLPETATECPAERVRLVAVPVLDELLDAGCQLFSAGELPVPNYPSLQNAKPDFDLVGPGGVLGRKDEMEPPSMPRIERFPRLSYVDVEIVPNDEDISLRVALRNLLHEFVQVFGGSPTAALTKHLSAPNVEGRQQSHRSVPLVFKLKPPWRAGLRIDDGMLASECLDARLFVDAQYGRSLSRCSIQLANPPHLVSKFRIRTVKPQPHPVRSKVLRPQN